MRIPVTLLIAERLPITLLLTAMAAVLALLIAVPLAFVAALAAGRLGRCRHPRLLAVESLDAGVLHRADIC